MRKLKATTLVELVVYMAVASAIGLVVVNFWQLIQQTNQRNQTVQLTTQQAESALYNILYLTEIADSVNTPTSGNQGSTLDLTISGVTNTITVNNNRLQITQGGTTLDLTTDDFLASGFIVRNLGSNGSIQVEFDLATENPDNNQALDFTYQASGSYTRPF